MASHTGIYKVSAQDATTVTLVPALGVSSAPDFADKISQIVLTFANARDSKVFDAVNREIEIEIATR